MSHTVNMCKNVGARKVELSHRFLHIGCDVHLSAQAIHTHVGRIRLDSQPAKAAQPARGQIFEGSSEDCTSARIGAPGRKQCQGTSTDGSRIITGGGSALRPRQHRLNHRFEASPGGELTHGPGSAAPPWSPAPLAPRPWPQQGRIGWRTSQHSCRNARINLGTRQSLALSCVNRSGMACDDLRRSKPACDAMHLTTICL